MQRLGTPDGVHGLLTITLQARKRSLHKCALKFLRTFATGWLETLTGWEQLARGAGSVTRTIFV